MTSQIPEELLHKTILVVDDLPDNRHAIASLLMANGFDNVLEAANGAEALRMLDSEREVDLVLLDILMPGMDGREVLDRMKSQAALKNMPVIMVTGVNDVESVFECIEQGASDYLIKPVDEGVLQSTVLAGLSSKTIRDTKKRRYAR